MTLIAPPDSNPFAQLSDTVPQKKKKKKQKKPKSIEAISTRTITSASPPSEFVSVHH
jgi:hypothetical protein